MPATAEEFFAGLAERGYEPVLHAASGTVRFDLRDGGKVERWLVSIDRGLDPEQITILSPRSTDRSMSFRTWKAP